MDLKLPKVIFGTSSLGNLYTALPLAVKKEIVGECVKHSPIPVVFDSAGKYGAGLALESLGKCLSALEVDPTNVIISNKLAWCRKPLTTPEPTFEPGVWKDLAFDAEQKISYNGIIECFEEGNRLLGEYKPQLISIHDPDEFLATAQSAEEEALYYQQILEAYAALKELQKKYPIYIGVGAKNWKAIYRIAQDVDLDWVMFANSLTIKSHPEDLLNFMEDLHLKGVKIINSAVFHAGFLTGGDYYDYRLIRPDTPENVAIFQWREEFFALCKTFGVSAAAACVQFALSAPGVACVALNTTNPKRVQENVALAETKIPAEFWLAMKSKGLIQQHYRYI